MNRRNLAKEDLFSSPIPRWVTHYGFLVLVFLVCLLLIFSFLFKVPRVMKVDLILSDKSDFLRTAVGDFQQLKQSKLISLSTHERDTIFIELLLENTSLSDTDILVPIKINNKDEIAKIYGIPSNIEGIILIDRETLFSKLIQLKNR